MYDYVVALKHKLCVDLRTISVQHSVNKASRLTSMMPMSEPSLEAAAAAAALLRESLAASEPDCLNATSKALLFLLK